MAHDHIEEQDIETVDVAPDISGHATMVAWLFFGGLVVALIVSIGLGILLFRVDLDSERYLKVGLVQSEELIALRAHEHAVLSGEKPVVEGKKSISIDDAMNRYIQLTRKN